MKPQFEKDDEGHKSVLNDILELIASTIHQITWKKDAVKKFCNHYKVTFHGELDKQGNRGASNHCFLNIVNGAAVRTFQNNYQSAMDKVFYCSFRAKQDPRNAHKFGWGGLDIKEEFRRSNRSADVLHVRYKSTNAPFMVQPESTTKRLVKSYNTAVSTLAKVAVQLSYPTNKVVMDLQNKMNELIAKSSLNTKNTPTHQLPPTMAAPAPALSSSIGNNNAHQLASAMAASTTVASASTTRNNAHLNTRDMYSSQIPTFQELPPQYWDPPPPLLNQHMAHQPANTAMALGANQVSTGVVHQQQEMERQQEELRAKKTAEELRAGQEALEASLALHAEQEAGAAEEVDKTAEALHEGQEVVKNSTASKDLGVEEQEPEGEKEQQQDEAAKNKAMAKSASTEDFLAENNAEATESTSESSTATVPKASTNNVGTKSSSEDEDVGAKLSSEDEEPSQVTFNKGDDEFTTECMIFRSRMSRRCTYSHYI